MYTITAFSVHYIYSSFYAEGEKGHLLLYNSLKPKVKFLRSAELCRFNFTQAESHLACVKQNEIDGPVK